MKKLSILFFFILSFLVSKSQVDSFPVKTSQGSVNTLIENKGGFRTHLINFTFPDTTTANTVAYFKVYDGAQIMTTTGGAKFWVRYDNAWNLMSGGGGASGWDLFGNTLVNPTAFIGTINLFDLNFGTNNLKRFSLDATGILPLSGSGKAIGVDSITGKLCYVSGGGAIDTVNLNFPLYSTYDIITGRQKLNIDTVTENTGVATLYQLSKKTDTATVKSIARLTFNITNQQVGDMLKLDSFNRVVNYTPNAGFRLIQFKPGYASAPAINDSVYTSDLIKYKYVQVSRNGVDLTLNQDFQKDSVGSSITFHPPLDSLDKIIINAYDLYPDITQLIPDSLWYPLSFPIRLNVVGGSSGIYNSSGGGSFDAVGLANTALTGNGMVEIIYSATDMKNSIIGFNTSNALEDYHSMEAGLFVSTSGLVYYIESGSATSTGVNLSVGDQIGVRHSGSNFYLQLKLSGTYTWSTLYTFSITASPTTILYVNINMLDNTSKFYYPQILK